MVEVRIDPPDVLDLNHLFCFLSAYSEVMAITPLNKLLNLQTLARHVSGGIHESQEDIIIRECNDKSARITACTIICIHSKQTQLTHPYIDLLC